MVSCTKCNVTLQTTQFNTGKPLTCLICHTVFIVDVFPAFLTDYQEGEAGEKTEGHTQASCFYHDDEKAERSCNYCGRFICGLCDLALNNEHLCPPCFEKGKNAHNVKQLKNGVIQYDSIALTASVVLVFFTAIPFLNLFVTIGAFVWIIIMMKKQKNKEQSLLPRKGWRFPLALFFTFCEIAAATMQNIILFK